MIAIEKAEINTAGAYICIDGLYPFAIGSRLHNGHIPVVRLGGHREEHETGWQCAVREVYEETNLQIKPLVHQTTYLSDWDYIETELQEIQWRNNIEHEPCPILVIAYERDGKTSLSLMYLAEAKGLPTPSSEVRGLLLLRQEEIHSLCQTPQTLEQYVCNGGKAVMNYDFDISLVLEPFAQLRLLSRILDIQLEVKAA